MFGYDLISAFFPPQSTMDDCFLIKVLKTTQTCIDSYEIISDVSELIEFIVPKKKSQKRKEEYVKEREFITTRFLHQWVSNARKSTARAQNTSSSIMTAIPIIGGLFWTIISAYLFSTLFSECFLCEWVGEYFKRPRTSEAGDHFLIDTVATLQGGRW